MGQPPYKLCYPQLGSYGIAIRHFVNKGLGVEYVTPPPMTKKTIEIGAKYSPDFVCAPFKFMMGCYIEALEKGANVMIGTGGTCRLGYYGELHEQILKDLGYDFEMFNLTLANYKNLKELAKGMKHFAPETSTLKMALALPSTAKMLIAIDKVEDYMRQNMGFEKNDGDFERAHTIFLNELRNAKGLLDVRRAYKKAMQTLEQIPIDKPEHPLRVGIIGEYFTVLDPESNHHVEKKLAKMGAEVHRWMTLSNSVVVCPEKGLLKKLSHYLSYDIHKFPSSIWHKIHLKNLTRYMSCDMGGSSVATAAAAEQYAKEGFDGLLHLKSFGCMPEMDVIPVLHNISADYKIPILYLSYDTQTSDTGIETRLEAFYDMIQMRKEVTES